MTNRTLGRQYMHFVGVDSDGCAFNTMELKHKEVFIPQAVESFGFEDIESVYRHIAERVNLYSRTRGANRFEAIAHCLDEMRTAPALRDRVPDPAPIWEFVRSGNALSNESFKRYLEDDSKRSCELLRRVLHWSTESNRRIAELRRPAIPFSYVRETLTLAHTFAHTMIVSATPASALEREWSSARLLSLMDRVAGQELGPKTVQLASAMRYGFDPGLALMVGDAPGDHKAAKENGMLFFPIVPGEEIQSWKELLSNGLTRFREGNFSGRYQTEILESYYRALDSCALH